MANLRVVGAIGLAFVLGGLAGYALKPGPVELGPDRVRASGLTLLDSYRDNAAKSLCFEFDRPLAGQGDADWKKVVGIAPEGEIKIEASGRDLCLSGFGAGGEYKVTLQAGLAAADGTRLAAPKEERAVFGTKDRQVSFSSRGAILPRIGAAGVPVETLNVDKLHVRITRVADRDLVREIGASWWSGPLSAYDARVLSRAATVVWEGSMAVTDKRVDVPVTTALPLATLLPNRLPGAYLLEVSSWSRRKESYYGDDNPTRSSQWVVDSDITLSSLKGEDKVSLVARSLDTAKALAGIDLILYAADGTELARTRTGADGRGDFAAGLLRGQGGKAGRAVFAFGPDGDFSVHDLARPAFDLGDRGVEGRAAPGPVDVFAWTDRGIYRPGETVHLSALMRDRMGRALDQPIQATIRRPDGSIWVEDRFPTDDAGGAHVTLGLPGSARMGVWEAEIRSDPTAPPVGRATFEVQDFVPRTLAVSAAADTARPVLGETLKVALQADWLYGAPAAGLPAEVTATLEAAPDPFPALKGWSFGRHDDKTPAREVAFAPGTTDARGAATLSGAIQGEPTTRPLQLRVETAVFETGGRPNPGTTLTLPVATLPFHVGLKPQFEGGRVIGGTVAAFDLLAVDPTGAPLAGKVLNWRLVEEEWHYLWTSDDGPWRYKISIEDVAAQTGQIASEGAPVTLKFPTKQWARYRLEVEPGDGGAPVSIRFAAGWRPATEGQEEESPDKVSVVPDKDRYKAGEVARIAIKPQFEGQALVAVAAGTLVETREVTIPAAGATIEVPVSADWGAGAYVAVSLHRPLKGEGARGPIRAVGVAWLGLDNSARTLDVAIAAPELLRPETQATIPLKITGGDGASPVFLTLTAVDEGILSITDYETPAPDSHYFGKRRLSVELRDDYGRLIDGRAAPAGRMRQGGDSTGARGLSVTPVRTVALFSGPVQVGADGSAAVELAIPDFSGKLRLMALAYSKTALGHGEAAAPVRPPVVADAFLPRFLSVGDEAELAVQLNNVEGREGPFRLEIAAAGPFALKGPAVFDLDLAAGQARSETVPIATTGLGIGTVSLALTGPGGLDIRRSWPLQSRAASVPVTSEQTEAQAPGAAYTVPPALVEAYLPGSVQIGLGFGYLKGIDVPGLLLALDKYPYGCTEQTVSRAMPLLAFDDPALLGLGGGVEGGAEIRARVQKAIETLVDRQGVDGRIGLWRRDDRLSSSWLMVFATDFLLRARDSRYQVPDAALEAAVSWMKSFAAEPEGARGDYSRAALKAARAYALYVLARNRLPDQRAMTALAGEQDLIPLARAMLGAALSLSGRRAEGAAAFDAAAQAGPGNGEGAIGSYASPLRDAAAFLALSVEARPGFDASRMLDQLAAAIGNNLALTNTQEKMWLLRVAQLLGRDTPVAVGVQVGTGPMVTMASVRSLALHPGPAEIREGYSVTNRGERPLYRTVTETGVVAGPGRALAQGFSLNKQWFTLDGAEVDPSRAAVARHERLVVRLTGKSQDDRQRRALIVDMLPAGFQIEMVLRPPAKAEKQDGAKPPRPDRLAWVGALSRLDTGEAKDDRLVAAFTLNEPDRDYYYDEEEDETVRQGREFAVAYVVRAVTPGRFALPGAAIEDMYRPSVKARTAAGTVEIGRD